MNNLPVGSSRFTRLKWERFAFVLENHIAMVKGIIAANRDVMRAYNYIDLYAGPGLYTTAHDPELAGEIGSPLIAARKLKAADVKHQLWLSDADRQQCDDLMRSLVRDGHGELAECVANYCCAQSVDMICRVNFGRDMYGLVFIDPNGYPDWDAVRQLSYANRMYRMDFLINVNATIHKRCRKHPRNPEEKRIAEHLGSLRKRYVYLWTHDDDNPHHFFLAYCTNNHKFQNFKHSGFHHIDSKEGADVLKRIDCTEAERSAVDPEVIGGAVVNGNLVISGATD